MNMVYKFIFPLLLLVQNADCRKEIHHSNVVRLMRDKLTSYQTNVRPLVDQSRHVDVNVWMELVSIQDIDEVEERLSLVAMVILEWQDEMMIWDPEEYGGVQLLIVQPNEIWTPNLMLINSADRFHPVEQDWNVIRVTHNGSVVHVPGDIFSVSCRIDSTYYPWDEQVCVLFMSLWMYMEKEVRLNRSLSMVGTEYLEESGSWELVTSEVRNYKTEICFRLHLKRKPTFVVVNVIFPVLLMALLNMLVFFIPCETGERISYSITVLLATAVFMTIVGDNLPKTSNPMSILSYFVATVLAISVVIVICTIQSLRLYHRDELEEISAGWRGLVTCMKCLSCKRRLKTKAMTTTTLSDSVSIVYDTDRRVVNDDGCSTNSHTTGLQQNKLLSSNVQDRLLSKKQTLYTTEPSKSSENGHIEDCNGNDCTWKDVSLYFDLLCRTVLCMLLLVSVVALCLCIFSNPSRSTLQTRSLQKNCPGI